MNTTSSFNLVITSPEDLHRSPTNRSQLTLNDNVPAPASEKGMLTTRQQSRKDRFRAHMLGELDSPSARVPLAVCCFLSGFVACVSFAACSIWVGFQSGNTVQVAMAISRLTYDPQVYSDLDRSFGSPNQYALTILRIANVRHLRVSDYQALTSILGFAIAAQIGGRLSPWQRKTRATITISAILQCLLTIAAAITSYYCKEPAFSLNRAEPSWHNGFGFATIGLLSASFGLQGVVGEVLGTGYTASVVLTSIWVQLAILPCPKKWSRPRDDRISAIILFCIGAFVSRMLLAKIGSHGTLAVAAGIRLALVPVWMLYCKSALEDSFLPVSAKNSPTRMLLASVNDSRVTVVNMT